MPVETTKIKICNLNNVLNFTCKGMHETGILPARNYYRMQELNFLDETLDLNQTSSYHLTMQAGQKEFSYCLLDLARNKYVALRHYTFLRDGDPDTFAPETLEVLSKDEFLARPYKSVYFIWKTQKFTLVPSPLFNRDQARMYFEFNHVADKREEINFCRLKKEDAYLVFAAPSPVCEAVTGRFRQAVFFHQGFALLEILLRQASTNQPSVAVCLHGNFLDIAVAEKKKLKIYNTFSYTHEHDMLFFILYIYEQLKLNQEEDELILSGEISKTSEHYFLLRRYLKKIRFARPDELYTYSYTFGPSAEHRFVNLLNLFACA